MALLWRGPSFHQLHDDTDVRLNKRDAASTSCSGHLPEWGDALQRKRGHNLVEILDDVAAAYPAAICGIPILPERVLDRIGVMEELQLEDELRADHPPHDRPAVRFQPLSADRLSPQPLAPGIQDPSAEWSRSEPARSREFMPIWMTWTMLPPIRRPRWSGARMPFDFDARGRLGRGYGLAILSQPTDR